MRRTFIRLPVFAIAVLGVSILFASPPGTGSADPGQSGLEQLTLEQLTLRADRIVVGTVADVSSLWIGDQIYTDATISVEQSVSGDAGDEVVVRQLGGEVGDVGLKVSNMPVFAPSERVVLFLRQRQDSTFEVVGLVQGKFAVEDDHVYLEGQRVPLRQFLQQVSAAAPSGGQSADSEALPQEVAPEESGADEGRASEVMTKIASIHLSEQGVTVGEDLSQAEPSPSSSHPAPREEASSEVTLQAPDTVTAGPALPETPDYEEGEVMTEDTLQALAQPPEYEQSEIITDIKLEGFEGSWPNDWTLQGNPTWGPVPCEPYSGSRSGWQSEFGSGNYHPCYPTDSAGLMVWGPFSTVGYSYGDVQFWQDLRAEAGFDWSGVMASVDGSNFYGPVWSGDSGGWVFRNVPLESWPGLGNLMGRPNVWIAFTFTSDSTIQGRGSWLDDIEIYRGATRIKFEGGGSSLPGWALVGSPTWGGVNCNPHSGHWSIWQSASAYDPCYPNNSNSWTVYGPFDLTNAVDGGVDFMQELETELSFDFCGVLASVNGVNFSGPVWSGDPGGWVSRNVPFDSWPVMGDLRGQPNVWIAFIFTSDGSNRDLGCFLDDIRIWKDVPPPQCYLEMVANPPEGGTTDPSPGLWEGPCGLEVPITPLPNPGWHFVPPWGGDPDCADGLVVLDGYETCIANFSPDVCTINSFDPAQASAGTGSTVAINGSNFGPSPGSVEFYGGVSAPVLSWSNTQIVVEVPKNASSGLVTVAPPGGQACERHFDVTFGYLGRKWPGPDPMGERILINANTADTVGEWRAVWEGAQTWNDVDAADFYFDYGGRTTGTGLLDDGVNQVFWTGSGLPPEALAVTGCWYSVPTDLIFDCDMAFNDTYDWDTSGSPGPSEYDVQSIALHEFGHFLACSDLYGSADSGKVMYGYGSSGTIKRNLHSADEECIRWIYPGSGTRGQYVVQITNNDDDSYPCVDFKSDLDAAYDRCVESVAAGTTTSSFETPVTAGSRTISIRWTDPDTGVPCEDSVGINVPLEGLDTASLEISLNCPDVTEVVVRMGSGEVAPGGSITLDLDALDVPPGSIGSFTIEVEYDPALLEATACTPDPDGTFDAADCNPSFDNDGVFPDKARCTGASTSGVSGPLLTLCDITFHQTPPATGPFPIVTPLPVNCLVLTTPGAAAIPCVPQDGDITIDVLLGDVNCDDLVNVVDALFILQYEVGLRESVDFCPLPPDTLYDPACDVNDDALCNVVDALFILQCEVGQPPGRDMPFCVAAPPVRQETGRQVGAREG